MKDVLYLDEGAAEYDRAFAHVSEHFLPFLLRTANLSPAMRVLDVATGTGLAAQAVLAIVGASGSVTATDISPAMVEQARKRLFTGPSDFLKRQVFGACSILRVAIQRRFLHQEVANVSIVSQSYPLGGIAPSGIPLSGHT
jgi:SAM-dependent methyltransferase